jgi:hypothetical protein
MKQFDAPKRKKKCEGTDPDDSDEEVADLQFALEELEEEVEDNDTDERVDGWEFDIRLELSESEIEKLEETVKPVRRVLAKVYLLINICLLN